VASLILRSHARSDRVWHAMRLRGHGAPTAAPPTPFPRGDNDRVTRQPSAWPHSPCWRWTACRDRAGPGRQDRHDRTLAARSVPVDHTAAVKIAVLRGSVAEVSSYAHCLFLERGLWHGTLALVPVRVEHEVHSHAAGEAHRHRHLRVQESF
jgi:hypothetical protein